jgi:hypothetical protein
MSKIVNSNFNRETKLDPAPLNAKFQGVATAVNANVNEENIRNSAIDVSNFNTPSLTTGKNNIQLVALKSKDLGSAGGTAVSRTSLGSPVAMPNTWNLGAFNILEGDIIRVYWNTTVSKNWTVVGPSRGDAAMRDYSWAQYLEWDFNGAGYAPVPGQTDFSTASPTGPGTKTGTPVANTKATCFLHFVRIIDDGGTAANTAPTDPAPASADDAYIQGDISAVYPNARHMGIGSWVHTVTAGEAGSKTIQLKLVMQGPLTPTYDGTASQNWIVRGTAGSLAATNPIMTFYEANMVFMIMRSK